MSFVQRQGEGDTGVSRPPVTGRPYLDSVVGPPRSVIAMAHRGGARHHDLGGAENTTAAFAHAVGLGYRYLETDVHATSDGVLLAFHDDVLDRVTDLTGPIAEQRWEQIAHARIASEHPVPHMADLLEAFPEARFNIDLKSGGAVQPLADLLERNGAHDRVCVGSFSLSRLRHFRRLTGGRVATSAAPQEVAAFLALPSALARAATRGVPQALQVPRNRGPLPVVTAGVVRRAHAAGVHVHVWTIDDPQEMNELIDLGVDGIITDRTDLLKDVLVARGLWQEH